MKKRIQIIVQPVDNGYTIQANSSDQNGQNARSVNLIAAKDDDVAEHVSAFVKGVFSPAQAGEQSV